MQKIISLAAIVAVLGLAACGDTDLERGATGAGIGAVGAIALDADPLTGAAVGAAAGVLCDDVTNMC